MTGTGRLARVYADLKAEGRAAFTAYVMAGDPDTDSSFELLCRLPGAGADVIELGVPFSDPMADGPAIQAAGQRALAAGMTLKGTLDLVRRFRARGHETPLVLMGYFNPIHAFGVERFAREAGEAGVDGHITVDLPPEEDRGLRIAAAEHGIATVRLATPTTDELRLPVVLDGAGGFLYYVAITGVTGTASAALADLEAALAGLRRQTDLPLAVGFGIKTPQDARSVARIADGVVVGSALVSRIAGNDGGIEAVLAYAAKLADAVHGARAAATVAKESAR